MACSVAKTSQHGYSLAAPGKCLIWTQDLAAIDPKYDPQ
jgi:hypothetical protein